MVEELKRIQKTLNEELTKSKKKEDVDMNKILEAVVVLKRAKDLGFGIRKRVKDIVDKLKKIIKYLEVEREDLRKLNKKYKKLKADKYNIFHITTTDSPDYTTNYASNTHITLIKNYFIICLNFKNTIINKISKVPPTSDITSHLNILKKWIYAHFFVERNFATTIHTLSDFLDRKESFLEEIKKGNFNVLQTKVTVIQGLINSVKRAREVINNAILEEINCRVNFNNDKKLMRTRFKKPGAFDDWMEITKLNLTNDQKDLLIRLTPVVYTKNPEREYKIYQYLSSSFNQEFTDWLMNLMSRINSGETIEEVPETQRSLLTRLTQLVNDFKYFDTHTEFPNNLSEDHYTFLQDKSEIVKNKPSLLSKDKRYSVLEKAINLHNEMRLWLNYVFNKISTTRLEELLGYIPQEELNKLIKDYDTLISKEEPTEEFNEEQKLFLEEMRDIHKNKKTDQVMFVQKIMRSDFEKDMEFKEWFREALKLLTQEPEISVNKIPYPTKPKQLDKLIKAYKKSKSEKEIELTPKQKIYMAEFAKINQKNITNKINILNHILYTSPFKENGVFLSWYKSKIDNIINSKEIIDNIKIRKKDSYILDSLIEHYDRAFPKIKLTENQKNFMSEFSEIKTKHSLTKKLEIFNNIIQDKFNEQQEFKNWLDSNITEITRSPDFVQKIQITLEDSKLLDTLINEYVAKTKGMKLGNLTDEQKLFLKRVANTIDEYKRMVIRESLSSLSDESFEQWFRETEKKIKEGYSVHDVYVTDEISSALDKFIKLYAEKTTLSRNQINFLIQAGLIYATDTQPHKAIIADLTKSIDAFNTAFHKVIKEIPDNPSEETLKPLAYYRRFVEDLRIKFEKRIQDYIDEENERERKRKEEEERKRKEAEALQRVREQLAKQLEELRKIKEAEERTLKNPPTIYDPDFNKKLEDIKKLFDKDKIKEEIKDVIEAISFNQYREYAEKLNIEKIEVAHISTNIREYLINIIGLEPSIVNQIGVSETLEQDVFKFNEWLGVVEDIRDQYYYILKSNEITVQKLNQGEGPKLLNMPKQMNLLAAPNNSEIKIKLDVLDNALSDKEKHYTQIVKQLTELKDKKEKVDKNIDETKDEILKPAKEVTKSLLSRETKLYGLFVDVKNKSEAGNGFKEYVQWLEDGKSKYGSREFSKKHLRYIRGS